MASDKRDFSNFKKFPGAINSDGIYTMPEVKYTDSSDRTRNWCVFIRLVRDGKRQSTVNWDLSIEKQEDILPEYFDTIDDWVDLPKNTIVEMWKSSGIVGGKQTRSIPTYIDEPALVGKKNQRNAFQRALIIARSDYLKKLNATSGKSHTKIPGSGKMYFPMLAKPYKTGIKHIIFPCSVQPKLDGIRAMAYLDKPDSSYEHVIIYSRTKKPFPSVDYLKELLYFTT